MNATVETMPSVVIKLSYEEALALLEHFADPDSVSAIGSEFLDKLEYAINDIESDGESTTEVDVDVDAT